jgi:hypothetical protein
MKKHLFLLLSMTFVAFIFNGSGLRAGDTDLSWVAGQVGYSSGVQTKTSEGIRIVYHVVDAKQAISLLKKGLKERDWQVSSPANVSVVTEGMGIFVGKLNATKGTASLEASTHGTSDSQTLVMILTGGTTPPPSAYKKEKAATPKQEAKTVKKKTKIKAETIVLDEDDINKTIFCEGHGIKIIGNECTIKVTGQCSLIYIMGNENIVRVEGTVDKIKTPGNKNTVTWQADQDPQPRISNLGSKNKLKAVN